MTERELPWLAPRAALQLVSQLGLGRGDGLQHGLQLPLCDDEVERRRDRGHLIGGGVRVRLRVRVRVRLRLRLRLRVIEEAHGGGDGWMVLRLMSVQGEARTCE